MEPLSQQRIGETVIEILKSADMEEMTEFNVRVAATERLGIDLSDNNHKKFIRSVVESFLLSTIDTTNDVKADSDAQQQTKEQQVKIKNEINDDEDLVICQLPKNSSVVIQNFKGKSLVSIRKYYRNKGKQIPSRKGISLSREQWEAFRKSVPAIEDAVTKMESKLRSEVSEEQNEDVANSRTSRSETLATEPDRFNGKNYVFWAQQMEYFLKQLKIAYVLTDPCPSVTQCLQVSAEEVDKVKVAERNWVNDDHLCRRHILNCLCDHLYYQCSKKTKSAKELWEDLKLVYLNEGFGTKRSQVKKYIEFQMVDEKSILEQVLELNNIANSIVAAGMLIDETFHVNVILSKLPSSWKDLCIKLMHQEFLTFMMLMDHIKVEEESRNRDKQGEPSKFVDFLVSKNFGQRMGKMKKPGMNWKRRESEMDSKTVVCFNCGKKGHVSKHCRTRKLDRAIKDNQNGENSTNSTDIEVNNVNSIAG